MIRAEEIDILLLQESGPRRRLRALGETLGMVGRAPIRGRSHAAGSRTRSSSAARRAAIVPAVSDGSREARTCHPRGVLVADVDERFSVMSVHLGLERDGARAATSPSSTDMIDGISGSFVIGADLNALPGDPGPTSLAELARTAGRPWATGRGRTFPSHAPTARIDYLFAGQAFRPLRAWTAGGTVSDHLMVVAELAITETGEDEATVRGS